MPPHNIPQTISQCDRQQHEVNHHSCVLAIALTISSVFSVRNAQAMAIYPGAPYKHTNTIPDTRQ